MTTTTGEAQAVIQRLLKTFTQFRRLQWQQRPMIGLTVNEVLVMRLLYAVGNQLSGDGVKISELGNHLRVSAPTMTQQLQTMEKAGLIEKTTDPTDRRAVRVRLSAQGLERIQQVHEAFTSSLAGLAEYLGEEDSARLADLLERVFAYYESQSDDLEPGPGRPVGSPVFGGWPYPPHPSGSAPPADAALRGYVSSPDRIISEEGTK